MIGVPARIPPADLDAEHATLGALLIEGRKGVEIARSTPLMPSDFLTEAHQVICGAIFRLHNDGQAVDMITLSALLEERGEIEFVGGRAKIAQLVEQASVLVHLEAYIGIVIDHGKRREAIQCSTRVITAAFDGSPIAELLEEAKRTVDHLSREKVSRHFDPAISWLRIMQGWKPEHRILTGIPKLDSLTGGMTRGDLMLVAGRTSHGKTTFTKWLARRLAGSSIPVDFLTLEESQDSIVRRLVAEGAGVPLRMLKDGVINAAEFDACEQAVERLQALPLRVIDLQSGIRSLDEDNVLAAVAGSDATVVMLDHLQKVVTKGESRNYGLERVLNRLHAMALRSERVIVVTVQLNREIDQRKSRPTLSDIRDTGASEILPRQVWAVYWPIKHHAKDEHGTAIDPRHFELYILKQHDGGTGMVPLDFDPRFGTFASPDPWDEGLGAPR